MERSPEDFPGALGKVHTGADDTWPYRLLVEGCFLENRPAAAGRARYKSTARPPGSVPNPNPEGAGSLPTSSPASFERNGGNRKGRRFRSWELFFGILETCSLRRSAQVSAGPCGPPGTPTASPPVASPAAAPSSRPVGCRRTGELRLVDGTIGHPRGRSRSDDSRGRPGAAFIDEAEDGRHHEQDQQPCSHDDDFHAPDDRHAWLPVSTASSAIAASGHAGWPACPSP